MKKSRLWGGLNAIICLSVLLWGAWASADEAKLSVVNTMISEWHVDNRNGTNADDDYGAFINRLNLSARTRGFLAQLRADTFLFSPKPDSGFQDDMRLERATVQVKEGKWTLIGGDFYRQLGQGLALAIRKEDESGVDISIQGGSLEYNGRVVDGQVFAGRVNPANLDSVSQKYVEDTDDVVVGSQLATRLGPLQLSGHGLFLYPKEEILGERDKIWTAGIGVEGPELFDWFSFAVEMDTQHRELLGNQCALLEEECAGYAGYANLDFSFGPLGFLVEGLWLDAFEQRGSRNTALGRKFDYALPPTLERKDQEILNTRDVQAGRIKAEYYVESLDLLFYANTTLRKNDPEDDGSFDWHLYGGSELYFQEGMSRAHLSGGYREESLDDRVIKTLAHGEVDYVQTLGDDFSTHVQILHEERSLEDREYRRGGAVLGLEWSQVGSLAFEYGYDTQNNSDDVRQHFFAGILSFELAEYLDFALLAGSRRGGLRCVAGVCREYPAFAGVQSKVIAVF